MDHCMKIVENGDGPLWLSALDVFDNDNTFFTPNVDRK